MSNPNQLQAVKKERETAVLITKIEELNLNIKTLTEEITKLTSEIAKMHCSRGYCSYG